MARGGGGFSRVALGDLDRDGDLDVAVVHRGDPTTEFKQDGLSVLLNDGRGRLVHGAGSPFHELDGRAEDHALADTDGDGWLDILTISGRAHVVSLFRGGAAGFEFAGSVALDGQLRGVSAGDLDGDGRAEVLVSGAARRRVVILAEASDPPRAVRSSPASRGPVPRRSPTREPGPPHPRASGR